MLSYVLLHDQQLSNMKPRLWALEDGFDGLIFDHHRMLSIADTKEILPLGGTILRTTNKGHPFEYREFDKEGRVTIQDYSKQTIENFNKLKLDCLFVLVGVRY